MSDYVAFFFPFYFESHALVKFNNPDLRQAYFSRRRDNKALSILPLRVPDLVRSSGELDPAVVQRDDKCSSAELRADLAAPEQHQRVHRHHAAVPDEDAARFHLLVVNQIRAVVVANLKQRPGSRASRLWLPASRKARCVISHRVVDRRGVHVDVAVVFGDEAELVRFGVRLHRSFARHLEIPQRSSDLRPTKPE